MCLPVAGGRGSVKIIMLLSDDFIPNTTDAALLMHIVPILILIIITEIKYISPTEIYEGYITHGIAKSRARATTPIRKQTANRMIG